MIQQTCSRLSVGLRLILYSILFLPSLLLSIFPSPANAKSLTPRARIADDSFFSQLQTQDFRIFTPAACHNQQHLAETDQKEADERLRKALSGLDEHDASSPSSILSWAPTGVRSRALPPQCSADHLGDLLRSTADSPQEQATTLQRFFNECNVDLTRWAPSSAGALISLAHTRYDFCSHSRVRKVLMRLPDGNLMRGFLAMQPGDARRPLVIVRCGVFCNAGDLSHRLSMMHLFDEGPFNVLAIASITGVDYARDNEHFALGGFDEGTQFLHVARMVQELPIRRYLSTVHLTGVSLGGQGSLYASYMNGYNFNKKKQPLIASTLTMCPVVELQPSMRGLFNLNLRGRFARWLFLGELMKVLSAVPILGDLLPGIDQTATDQIPNLVADSAVAYYKNLDENWALPPFQRHRILSRDDLWAANNFIPLSSQAVGTPSLVFAADDDWIVDTVYNTTALGRALYRGSDNKLQAVTVPTGNHCAFSTIYGWDISSSLMRNYLISHSPDLMKARREEMVPIRTERLPQRIDLWKAERHLQQEYRARVGSNWIQVVFRIWNGYASNGLCWTASIYEDQRSCIRVEVARIPYTDIPAPWARTPQNQAEAEALTRWLNANLRIVDADGHLLHDVQTKPAYFRWTTYDLPKARVPQSQASSL